MAESSQEEDWAGMLDRLSACITPQEDEAVRRLGRGTTIPAPLLEVRMHNLVASLLVKHALTTWPQLHASFPGYASGAGGANMESLEGMGGHTGDALDECQTSRQRRPFVPAHDDSCSTDNHRQQPRIVRSQAPSAEGHEIGRKRRSEAPARAAGSRLKQARNLAASQPGKSTLADFPSIVSWWHPTKNGTNLPADYSHGSHKRVWLQCPGCPTCGEVHDWEAMAFNLTQRDGDWKCPSCASKGGLFCSCRAIPANERLAAEWHEDNPPPATVAQGSYSKYKWRCSDAACGHIWEATPHDRSRADGGRNCPKCAVKRSLKGRKHPSVAVGRPELLAEWDEEKNTLLPTEVSCGSDKKVWWLCQVCGNSWQASVANRALNGRGCQKCRQNR